MSAVIRGAVLTRVILRAFPVSVFGRVKASCKSVATVLILCFLLLCELKSRYLSVCVDLSDF